jgi:hypothetical protein
MNPIEEIARAALGGDAMAARSLVQDLLQSNVKLSSIPEPAVDSPIVRSLSAALVELIS